MVTHSVRVDPVNLVFHLKEKTLGKWHSWDSHGPLKSINNYYCFVRYQINVIIYYELI